MPAGDALVLRFEHFELDPARFELRRDGQAAAVEPQVLSLLLLLASNPDRLVSKDEIVEKIWDGRIISEAAVSARIKSARQALGDDGKQQRLIRTVHGKGFRFVGDVEFRRPMQTVAAGTIQAGPELPHSPERDSRPSIAVLPFRLAGAAGVHGVLADALSDELIADLARLRWLFVIARGSSFRFRGSQVDCRKVGEALGVSYCLTGSIAFAGPAVSISVELVDTGSAGVIWAESYSEAIDQVHELRREIAASVVTALEIQIPANEAKMAREHGPGELDAWSAYHIGLDHMFRFNRADNVLAAEMFERAIGADASFARAYAGLSFTHFQNAFLNYQADRTAQVEAAQDMAAQALQWDRLDPFCHLNMGRSLWLEGDLADSIEWLNRATVLSPSYAQGIYSRAWAKTLSGAAGDGDDDARLALQLSPLDPLRYAMLATQSLSHIARGNFEEAAVLGERAARSPGAHKHIAVIAAMATQLAGEPEAAGQWIGKARRADPELSARDFLSSFPFTPSAARETIERSLGDLGL
ncbi:MAG: winged helix-turn-helix domain-containing protein [Novosphingobium sp.]|nr:winged helix-turn-helix domain-containing protein [Novosphingobium sp.]